MIILYRILRWLSIVISWFALLIVTLWAFGALWFDAPAANRILAIAFLIACVAVLGFVRPRGRKLAALAILFGAVLIWWFTLKPSNEANWQPDVAQLAWAEFNGDEVTLHNVRNCDYRTEINYTPHWETRAVRISQIIGIDLAINYWGSPWMAHPIVSFQFADAPPLCFSIETRKKVGQTYSAIGGLYRQFQLIYIVADERDVIRVRTNYRKGEDVYLYHTTISPEQARERFLEYIHSLNAMREKPRWYNAITTNCTTSIRTQRPPGKRTPWDWRILLNGKGDEMMYERHLVVTGGLPFAELKARSLINARAKAANASPDFSLLIRVGLPPCTRTSDQTVQRFGSVRRDRRQPSELFALMSNRGLAQGKQMSEDSGRRSDSAMEKPQVIPQPREYRTV
jgi:hypothetical protein